SHIKYTAEADGGAFLIWGAHASDVTYSVDTLGTAANPTGGALVIYGDSASGVTFNGGRGDDAFMIFGAGTTGATFDAKAGDGCCVVAGDTSPGVHSIGGAGNAPSTVIGHGLSADLDGGADDDSYVFGGTASGSVKVDEPAAAATDTLDFSSFQTGAVTLHL